MMTRRAALASVGVACGVTFASGRAQGASATERLVYNAPASCPAAPAFLAQVESRVPGFARGEVGGSYAFDVEVTASAEGFRGSLTATDAAGAHATRDVSGSTCEEVLDALGLVLSLAVASTESAEPPAPVAPVPVPLPVPSAPPSPDVFPTPSARPSAANVDVPRARARQSAGRFGASAGVMSAAGISSSALVGEAFVLEGRFGGTTTLLGIQNAESGSLQASNGATASLRWTTGTAAFCPIAWRAGRFSATPCARFSSGVLDGRGINIAHPSNPQQFWADAGAVARGEWLVVGPAFVALEAGAAVPLTRPRFHFDTPDITVAAPAPVTGIGTLCIGARFL